MTADGDLPHAAGSTMRRPTPDARTTYRHFRTISTRWMDNDVYGHINNVVYYSYFDMARVNSARGHFSACSALVRAASQLATETGYNPAAMEAQDQADRLRERGYQ